MERDKITELDGRSWVSLFSKLDDGCYRQELPKRQRVQVCVLYVFLFLVSAALYLAASAQGFGANNVWYVVGAEILVLACMLRMMAALITYLPMGQEMSSADHNRSSFALKRSSICAAVFQIVSCVGAVVYMHQNAAVSGSGLLAAGLFLASAVPMAVLYGVERSILYSRIPNPSGE